MGRAEFLGSRIQHAEGSVHLRTFAGVALSVGLTQALNGLDYLFDGVFDFRGGGEAAERESKASCNPLVVVPECCEDVAGLHGCACACGAGGDGDPP